MLVKSLMELVKLIIQNLPPFLGFVIGCIWLLYTSLKIAKEKDLTTIINEWFTQRPLLLPSVATFSLPFLLTYLYQEIPLLIEKWKLDKFVGIFGAVIGAILGFLISEFRQWKTEGQQAQTVRTMLKIEINQNIDALREFGRKINLDKSNENMCIFKLNDDELLYIPVSIKSNSLPESNRKIFNSPALILPLALALNREEIKDVNILYGKIDQISDKHSQLINLLFELNKVQKDKNFDYHYPTYKQKKEMFYQIKEAWIDCEKLIHEITEDKYWWS